MGLHPFCLALLPFLFVNVAVANPTLVPLKITSPAEDEKMDMPFACDFDAMGNLYFVEYGSHRLRMIDRSGKVSTLAGTGKAGSSGDGGPATAAMLNSPHNLAVHKSGDIYIADSFNRKVRRVDGKSHLISTFAGTGEKGFSGDGGPADAAKFTDVMCIAFDAAQEHLYIADIDNRRIRVIDMKTKIVTTVAGNGRSGVPKDGATAAESPLVDPRAVAADRDGNVYVLERSGNALRIVNRAGDIRTIAGTGKSGYSGDDGPALSATMNGPKYVSVMPDGDVLIADTENHVIRRYVTKTGILTTIAGTGKPTKPANDKPPTESPLNKPHGVTVGPDGSIYIADSGNGRILRMEP